MKSKTPATDFLAIVAGQRPFCATEQEAIERAAAMRPSLYKAVMANGVPDQVTIANEKAVRAEANATRARARAEFINAVHAEMKEGGCDYSTAWNRTCESKREIYATFTNAAPVRNPAQLAMLGLEASTNQEIFDLAFEANGKVFAPRKEDAIRAALRRYHGQFDSVAALEIVLKKNYPKLFR